MKPSGTVEPALLDAPEDDEVGERMTILRRQAIEASYTGYYNSTTGDDAAEQRP